MKISNIFLIITAITIGKTIMLTIMSSANSDISEKVRYFRFYDIYTHRLLIEIPHDSIQTINAYVKAYYKNDQLQKVERFQEKALIMTLEFQYDREGILLSSLLCSANTDRLILVYKLDNKNRIEEIDFTEKENRENILSAHFLEYDHKNRLRKRVYAHEGIRVNSFYYDKEGFIEKAEKHVGFNKIEELLLETKKYTYYDDY